MKKYALVFGRRTLLFLILSVIVGILAGLCDIAVGMALQQFLVAHGFLQPDNVVESGFTVDLPLILLIVGASAVLRYFATCLPGFVFEYQSAHVREAVVAATLLGECERTEMPLSTVNQVLNNILQKVASFSNQLCSLSTAAFGVLTVLSGMLYMSWKLSIVMVIIGAVAFLPSMLMRKRHHYHSTQSYVFATQFAREIIRDVRHSFFLKILGANQARYRHFRDVSGRLTHHQQRYVISTSFNSINSSISIVVLMCVIIINEQQEFITLAMLIPFFYLVSRLNATLSQLVAISAHIQLYKPYVQELLHLAPQLFTPRRIVPKGIPLAEQSYSLSAHDLCIGRHLPLAADINFDVAAGEMMVVAGHSGIGKTTLLLTLIGILPRFDGRLTWNNQPIETIDLETLLARVGYAGADPYLFDGTIRENLSFGFSSPPSDVEIGRALRLARADFVFELAGGLGYLLAENGEGISAGQRQRLAMARALLRNPSILLMDEATANIDEETEAEIISNIRSAFPSLMIFAVSHRASMQKFANKILHVGNNQSK